MSNRSGPGQIALADAIAGLRAELSRAQREAIDKDIRFAVDKIEVEMSLDFGWTREANGGFKLLSFVNLGAKAGDNSKTGHNVKLTLAVDGTASPTEPFRISGRGPAPELEDEPGS